MSVACQKEPSLPQVTTAPAAQYVMCYNVDGITYEESIDGEIARRAFWQRIFSLVREGYEIDVFAENTVGSETSSKDVVVYTTESEEDAMKWSEKMTDKGYHVHISFKNGTYTCTAVK